jgi:hypothetical protein
MNGKNKHNDSVIYIGAIHAQKPSINLLDYFHNYSFIKSIQLQNG